MGAKKSVADTGYQPPPREQALATGSHSDEARKPDDASRICEAGGAQEASRNAAGSAAAAEHTDVAFHPTMPPQPQHCGKDAPPQPDDARCADEGSKHNVAAAHSGGAAPLLDVPAQHAAHERNIVIDGACSFPKHANAAPLPGAPAQQDEHACAAVQDALQSSPGEVLTLVQTEKLVPNNQEYLYLRVPSCGPLCGKHNQRAGSGALLCNLNGIVLSDVPKNSSTKS